MLFEQIQVIRWKFLTLVRLDSDLVAVQRMSGTSASVVKDETVAEKLEELGERVVFKPFNFEELLAVPSGAFSGRTAASRLGEQG